MSDSEPTLPDPPDWFQSKGHPFYEAFVQVFLLEDDFIGLVWNFSDGEVKYQIVAYDEIISVYHAQHDQPET